MRKLLVTAATLVALGAYAAPQQARACGGFFCGQQPVDQSAERIVFASDGNGNTTMVVQIAYAGAAPDFAWVLPLAQVPERDSLDVFPQRALVALDVNTGPTFQFPDDPDCWDGLYLDDASPSAAGGRDGGVTVHIREVVGPYDVAVVESTDPAELVRWLRTNGFRVTSPMEPYIRTYTAEGMKFLALRLQPGADTNDIEPFKLTLPGTSPSIPLRLTALAAEPEMGILVMVLGDQRFGPANWPDITIDDAEIVWRPYGWPTQTNWASLVARKVDDAGGRGWVTEFAGELAPIRDLVESSPVSDEEQERAQRALLDLMGDHAYVTRLYTRLSAEEMTLDPVFRRVTGGDVDRNRMLPRYDAAGRDMCDFDWSAPDGGGETTVCDFATCGAGGLCRRVAGADGAEIAGCACVPGTTARTTVDAAGQPTVICQDMRMSFLNPGDREVPGATPLPDPCVGFECGAGGECVAMNMTPTCRCAGGTVAVGGVTDAGSRVTNCVAPMEPIPQAFYNRRLPALPAALPGGRIIDVPPAPDTEARSGCSVSHGGDASSQHAALLGLLGLVGLIVVRRRR